MVWILKDCLDIEGLFGYCGMVWIMKDGLDIEGRFGY